MRTHSGVHVYKGFMITVRDVVLVWDPSCPHDPALYTASSIDEAMCWISAYRSGSVEIEYTG